MGKKKRSYRKKRKKPKNTNYLCYFIALMVFSSIFGYACYMMKKAKIFSFGGNSNVENYSKRILSFGKRSHPNTPGLLETREFLTNELEEFGYSVFTQESTQLAYLLGELDFVNIMGIYENNPLSNEYTILAAHYDSKYFTEYDFLGATDSAVPVAMVLDLAKRVVEENLNQNYLVIFFDGEEAFGEWTQEDSLYGSRSLAEEWKENGFLEERNMEIKMFMLLDLIGDKKPMFLKFSPMIDINPLSEEYYDMLSVKEWQEYGKVRYFTKRLYRGFINDDHEPFMDFGFPIVHLIPVPFPKVWHQESDNLKNVDFESVCNIQTIIFKFLEDLDDL